MTKILIVVTISLYCLWAVLLPYYIGYEQGTLIKVKRYDGLFDKKNLPMTKFSIKNFSSGKNYLEINNYSITKSEMIENVYIRGIKEQIRWPFYY